MQALNQAEWTQANKQDLRDLYASFLEDTSQGCEDVSYAEFQDFMYAQTKHAAQ